MVELICDTSALIALHQVGLLQILRAFCSVVIVPAAVEQELAMGRFEGYDLLDVASFDWMTIRTPTACPELPHAKPLGAGESNVLWLALVTAGYCSTQSVAD